MPISPQLISFLTFNQLDVARCPLHKSILASTLSSNKEELKADGYKVYLLIIVFQASTRNRISGETTASPPAGGPAVSGGASHTSGPSTKGWYNPGANNKKRAIPPTVALSYLKSGPILTPPRHLHSNNADKSCKSLAPGRHLTISKA